MSKSSLHLALQFSIRIIKGSKPFRKGLISMIVTAKLHLPPIDVICSLEHERAK